MKKGITSTLSLAILAGAVGLWGCEKVAPGEPSPVAASVPAALKAPATPAQAAWLQFVERVERGEAKDPNGQYVAKGTPGATDATGQRLRRPKFDAATARYGKSSAGQPGMQKVAPNGNGGVMNYVQPCDPCGDGGGGTTVYSTFTTSENLGGSGYIHDLKIVNDANSPSRVRALNNGYTLLNADLNRGAGGAYIYLAFQRDPANVLNALEYYQGQPYSDPNDVLTNFETQRGNVFSKPPAHDHFFDIWVPNQNPYPYWGTQDLNAGAGGEYIYSYLSKTPSVITPGSSITTLWNPMREIGILSGNSSTIIPPPGWTKYSSDLNEGAGGDYIYFCYRN